nr:receptor-like protein EIX2 [Malus domestica]
MEGDRIRCLKKLFRALIVVFTLLQCAVNPSLSLGFKNISSEGVVRCFEREREALLAFKHGLVDPYNLLSSWGREEHKQDCCKWVGVHCSNRTNHVTQLHLGWYPLSVSYSHQQKGDPQFINYFLQGKKMSPKLIELQRLKYLDLSWINFNGTRLPYFIGSLFNLRHLDLSSASFGGRFPSQVGNLTHLQYLDLSWNDFNSVENLKSWLPLLSFFNTYLDLSSTNLNNAHDWLEIVSKLPKLTNLTLQGCGLPSPVIHSSTLFNINSSKSLASVDLSDNQCTSPSIYLWLSNYNASLVFLGLDNSSLTALGSCKMGPYFPKWLQTQNEYSFLDISDAGIVDILPSWFWGSISILCEAYESLMFLNLSNNNLSGELPQCWTHFDHLVMLDLSYNAFSGKIPSTVGSLYRMETLKLRSNRFVGEFPSSFKNCTSLKKVLDVGYNQLSGPIPKWLGVSLQKLVVLMLSSNNFNGSMPSELCCLTNIQNLDVSANNISGTIPKCLSNFTVLAQKGNSSPTLRHLYTRDDTIYTLNYMDDATFIWKGRMYSYKNTLGLVKRIDFSSNRLTGEIPSEITDLVGLVSLNLSRNGLTGELPAKIGKLQSLDALDLSRNQIDGRIPTSLAQIYGLSVLDLSYNNFIGKIPTGTQLQSFDPSDYAGNPQLCGPPLPKMCGDQHETPISSNEEEKDEPITWGFYVSMALGFVVGFWGVCGSLIFVRPWRYSYFRFLNV